MNASNVGNWLASLLTGLLLVALLIKWGHKLPKSVKLDDLVRILVAVFGVAGPLYVTPRFHGWANNIQSFFTSGAHGITASPTLITILAVAIFLLVAYAYLASSSWGRLALLVVVALPLFSNQTMLTVAQWWIDHPGSWLFRELISALNSLAGY